MPRRRSYTRAILGTIREDPPIIIEFLRDVVREIPRGPTEVRNTLHVWHRTVQVLQEPDFLDEIAATIKAGTIEEIFPPGIWNEGFTDDFGQRITNVHAPEQCEPPCPIHHPSQHHMRDWPLLYRSDRRIFERICPHHIGHPDPDSMAYHERHGNYQGGHGCDGCCAPPGPLSTAPRPEWDPED